MKRACEIIVLSQRVVMIEDDPALWATNAMGRSSIRDGMIQLNATMAPDVKAVTLLHEMLHYVSDINALPVGNDETQISVLANAMFSFIRDNSALIEAMVNGSDLVKASCREVHL